MAAVTRSMLVVSRLGRASRADGDILPKGVAADKGLAQMIDRVVAQNGSIHFNMAGIEHVDEILSGADYGSGLRPLSFVTSARIQLPLPSQRSMDLLRANPANYARRVQACRNCIYLWRRTSIDHGSRSISQVPVSLEGVRFIGENLTVYQASASPAGSYLHRNTTHIVRHVQALPHISRAHVYRIGDGGAHLHVWFFARPEGQAQLYGSWMVVWDDLLPEYPADVADADALVTSYGGRRLAL